MAGNNIVTKTVNQISFKVNHNEYSAAINKIRNIGREWAKASGKIRPVRVDSGLGRANAAAKQQLELQRKMTAEIRRTNAARQKIQASAIRGQTRFGDNYISAASALGLAKLNADLKSGAISAQVYNAKLAQINASLRRSSTQAQATAGSFSTLNGAIGLSAAAYGVGRAVGSIMTTGNAMNSMSVGLTMVSGSAQQAGQEMEWLRGEAQRLGLSIAEMGKQYTRFAVSAKGKLDTSQIHDLFSSMSEYGLAVGATADESSRALIALNQMLSKGTIQSEELRGQFAEALPGGVQLFVKALQEMKHNTKLTETDLFNLMKQGKLMAKDILPHLAKQMSDAANTGGALTKQLQSSAVALNRAKSAWANAQNTMFNSGMSDRLRDLFSSMSDGLTNNQAALRGVGHFFSGIIEFAKDAVNAVSDMGILITAIVKHYAKKWNIDLSKAFDWAGYAAGATVLIGALGLVGRSIAVLVKSMRSLLGLMSLANINTGEGDGKDKGKNPKQKQKAPKLGLLALMGRFAWPVLAIEAAQEMGYDFSAKSVPDSFGDNNMMGVLMGMFEGVGKNATAYQPTFQPPPSSFAPYNIYRANQQQPHRVEIENKISLKTTSEFDKNIEARIEENNQKQINMIMGGAN